MSQLFQTIKINYFWPHIIINIIIYLFLNDIQYKTTHIIIIHLFLNNIQYLTNARKKECDV